jgi:hypothetical protein
MLCIVRQFRRAVLCAALGSLAIAVGQARADLLAGFETGADLQRWSAQGMITVQRAEGPPGPEQSGPNGPAGSAARIDTAGQGGLFIKAGQLPPDLSDFDTLRFWVHRDPAAAAPSTIEVRFYEADGTAWFWRKVVLDQPGWSEVVVPFKWTRWSRSRIPRWEKVNRLGIYFRDAADVLVDSFGLADDPPANGPDDKPVLTPQDVATLAFGAAAADPGQVRIVTADGITVITDAPDCEAEALRAHLAKVAAAVKADMPFADPPANPVMLVVFAAEDRYRRFPVAMGERLGASAAPTRAGGYTLQGVATSFWDPRHGTLRPVFTHEFVHAWLSATLHLDNSSEWFQEGLAAHYQLRFHPQDNIRAVVGKGLDAAESDLLAKTCSGSQLPLDRYWVAATLCRTVLEDPALAARLPAVVAAVQKSGSTAIEPLLPVLGLSQDELDGKWRAFCRRAYGTAPAAGE